MTHYTTSNSNNIPHIYIHTSTPFPTRRRQVLKHNKIIHGSTFGCRYGHFRRKCPWGPGEPLSFSSGHAIIYFDLFAFLAPPDLIRFQYLLYFFLSQFLPLLPPKFPLPLLPHPRLLIPMHILIITTIIIPHSPPPPPSGPELHLKNQPQRMSKNSRQVFFFFLFTPPSNFCSTPSTISLQDHP